MNARALSCLGFELSVITPIGNGDAVENASIELGNVVLVALAITDAGRAVFRVANYMIDSGSGAGVVRDGGAFLRSTSNSEARTSKARNENEEHAGEVRHRRQLSGRSPKRRGQRYAVKA